MKVLDVKSTSIHKLAMILQLRIFNAYSNPLIQTQHQEKERIVPPLKLWEQRNNCSHVITTCPPDHQAGVAIGARPHMTKE